ncbi:multidrug DMT transporter permease [Sinomonas susongensis]|uniref:multidrug DMT transporter permease n=1 Tax=Sinomonas susongensis TaxID=1324851 RepID=UPI001107E3CC|nr:multidrug DMT transporter permease [Sinomonas susongensis]
MLTVRVALAEGLSVFSSTHWLGIPIALLGAVFLALGTIYQSRGVEAEGEQETSFRGLVRRRAWLVGTGLIGAAIILQLAALRFSPLMVVQPIGAAALVVTAVANGARSHRMPGKRESLSIILCIAGIGAFVAVAALSAEDIQVDQQHMLEVLILMCCAIVAAFVVWVLTRRHPSAAAATAGAGVLYGFVATLAKAVIGRIVQGDFEWLALAGLAGLGIALALGTSLVQKAHASGSNELVVAGLTVIDPLVAVTLAITVLGEAASAPPVAFVGFVAAGAAAVAGVWIMSVHQPETSEDLE